MNSKDLLIPFGKLFGTITDIRNGLYERGWLKEYDLGAKTISIGNITTGGTGKTPLTALVANILAEMGEKACILTRGYGRSTKERVVVSDGYKVLADARTGGDEPVDLANKLLGKAAVIADADRVAAAAWARQNLEVTAFILDDGFQHRRAKRDLNILCVDTTDPWGNSRVLPAGNLRENLKNIQRADIVVLTRSELANSDAELAAIEKMIRSYHKNIKIFRSRTDISELRPLNVSDGGVNGDLKLFAFSGIGNPAAFVKDLKRFAKNKTNTEIVSSLAFGDHHVYDAMDIARIEKLAADTGANALVTTAKDAVKLIELEFSMPCHVAEIEMLIDDQVSFRDLVIGA